MPACEIIRFAKLNWRLQGGLGFLPQTGGNRLADKSTKHAAEKSGPAGEGSIRTFVLSKMPELILTLPQYTLAQDQLAEAERATKNEKRQYCPRT